MPANGANLAMWMLYLDDVRPIPEGYVGARSVAEAIVLVNRLGWPVKMSLDHDLGMLEGPNLTDAPTGFDFCIWLAGNVWIKSYAPSCEYVVHSANPIGAERMRQLLSKL